MAILIVDIERTFANKYLRLADRLLQSADLGIDGIKISPPIKERLTFSFKNKDLITEDAIAKCKDIITRSYDLCNSTLLVWKVVEIT